MRTYVVLLVVLLLGLSGAISAQTTQPAAAPTTRPTLPPPPYPWTDSKLGDIPAFPGAEGAGMYTIGGRGGKVYVVTSLADSGPGTFRAACEANGPRTVVFNVAGIIKLNSPVTISSPYITIAGQTAPGDGVCVAGQTTEVNTHNVIIRYVRFRRGLADSRDDALGGHPEKNIIVDHVSTSWGLDETLSMYRHMYKTPENPKGFKMPTENLTIQWSIASEGLNPNNHAFGATWGGRVCSFHHNLFACNTGRNPSIGWGDFFDYRNNVIFNWRHRTMDGGDASSVVNVINNYYKPGPACYPGSIRYRICKPEIRYQENRFPGSGKWYVAGNVVVGNEKVTKDNWDGGVQPSGPGIAPSVEGDDRFAPWLASQPTISIEEVFASIKVDKPWDAPLVTMQTAEQAYELVLASGGALLPRRDAVDVRVIEMVRTGKVTFDKGIIDSPDEVGGYPKYQGTPYVDSDGDGMPDDWEIKNGLNPNDASDAAMDKDNDGYTNLEEYLNGTDPTKFVDYKDLKNNVNTLKAQ